MFQRYQDIIKFLNGLGLFHMDLTLSRVQHALQALGFENLPFYVVQIVGTNGKGSTATFLQSLARAHGIRTGLFTSPHFVSPSERILCQGKPFAPERWPSIANTIHSVAPHLTYFEFLTLLAVLAFVADGVELAIFEAGLGGQFDSTTAVPRNMLCFTPISMDHESVLGDNIAAITKDKANAMQQGMSVYCAEQLPEAMDILQVVAEQNYIKLKNIHSIYLPENIELGLMGPHQVGNAKLAMAAFFELAEHLDVDVHADKMHTGLAKAFIPGRMQYINFQEGGLELLLDGAHNEQGLQVLISALSLREQRPSIIIFSCMADKNMSAMLPKLKQLRALCDNCPLIIVGLQDNERVLSVEQRQELAQHFNESKVFTLDSLRQGLDYAHKLNASTTQAQQVLICGSLYLVGEFFEMYPDYLLGSENIKAIRCKYE